MRPLDLVACETTNHAKLAVCLEGKTGRKDAHSALCSLVRLRSKLKASGDLCLLMVVVIREDVVFAFLVSVRLTLLLRACLYLVRLGHSSSEFAHVSRCANALDVDATLLANLERFARARRCDTYSAKVEQLVDRA